MKTPARLFPLLLLFSAASLSPSLLLAQGTAFTYQGRLQSDGNPANGTYDLTFALYNAGGGGSQVGSTVTHSGVGVTNGLFTVILDYGAVFNGSSYWLQIGVRTNGVGSYTALSPRQELTPTPYAITAENVDGLVSASQLTGVLGMSSFPIPLDLSGSTVAPLLEADQAGAGPAILGAQTASSGTAAGVQGATASTASSANAIYGLVSSTSPGGFSAAVRGQNNGTGGLGIGVYGSQAGSGWGVYGTTPSGYGVYGASGSGIGVIGSSSSGDGIDGSSGSAIGVNGAHTATTGTAAGVQGTTASTDANASAISGIVSSTSPGGFSTAVRGQNNGTSGFGIGVYGSQAGGGWGVYGTAPGGLGVYGYSSSGIGVEGSSATGTGVYASSSSGSALSIGGGAFHVLGAGTNTSTTAFIHVATAANTSGYITTIHNPLCDGDPNAILIATHQFNPPGVSGQYETHPYSVWYNGSNWTIYNDDLAAIQGLAFNVLIIKN